jgi:sulfite dehydrogenase (quinone) subunit SoeA
MQDHDVELSPQGPDEIKYTTCYMCACRCGIKVHIKDNQVKYIEGNRNHPVNQGVLCGKGSAGIMQHNSPARLKKPLKRVGPRGSGEFKEIDWEEALDIATAWLARARATNPRKLAFFTGRDQSQSLTSWWAQQFGTPNYAAHGGFCSVNMAAAGLYTMGSAFWEFGEPDWDRTKYFMMFGVAEDHDSNPIKRGLGKLKTRGAKYVAINPVKTGYAAIADEWIGIRPGTDGLFILSLVHELLRSGKVDAGYLQRYTNAPWLVIDAPGTADDGLFARDENDKPQCWDRNKQALADPSTADVDGALNGRYQLPDGRNVRPSFEVLAERYLDAKYTPEAVADQCGVPAASIKRIAAELAHVAFEEEIVIDQPWTDWTGRKHDKMIGRPVSMHAMRGISAHSNGFHTCRAIHILQLLLGSVDVPGGWRFKAPYPKGLNSLPRPSGRPDDVSPNTPLRGPHLGFSRGPEDLLIDDDGEPQRIDKAFSWDAPMAAHGMMHMVISNAWKGDPYKIDTLFMYMANMAWNSSMNTDETIKMLTDVDPDTGEYKIPRIIYSDAYYSETVAYADLILPDTTYLERWDCISMLDRPIGHADGAGDAIRQPVMEPDRDVRPFQSVLLDLGARLGLSGMVNEDGTPKYPDGYRDYITYHERRPGIGLLAGWRGRDGKETGTGEPNAHQIEEYIKHQCFWHEEFPDNIKYFKHVNKDYLEYAHKKGFIVNEEPIIAQLYSEEMQKFRLAADGHGEIQPPENRRDRIREAFDPLPTWYATYEDRVDGVEEFPLHAITQRPMVMYHSWGTQNAWLRQIHGQNALYISRDLGAEHDLTNGDWAWLTSRSGRIKVQVKLMDGVEKNTVWTWNAIGKRGGAWRIAANSSEVKDGFLMNHLIDELLPVKSGDRITNSDPVTGQAAWYDARVKIEKASPGTEETLPQFPVLSEPPDMPEPPKVSRFGAAFRKGGK